MTEITHELLWLGPEEHLLINLAPRVQGRDDYVGDYGYALALTHDKIRVIWDDGRIDDVPFDSVLFFADGGRSA